MKQMFQFVHRKNMADQTSWLTCATDVLTLASSIAFRGRWTLGNTYKDPVTSLHVIPSREFNNDVVILAFLWYESKMAIFSYEMKVGVLNLISIVGQFHMRHWKSKNSQFQSPLLKLILADSWYSGLFEIKNFLNILTNDAHSLGDHGICGYLNPII